MRLLILGATGGIGTHLVNLALAAGHDVTVLARSPEKLAIAHKRLKVMKGNLLNEDELTSVMPGQEAVLSAFGPASIKAQTTRGDFGRVLGKSMQRSGVKRVLLVSSAMLFTEVGMLGRVLRSTIMTNVMPDMKAMEQAIMKDSLSWTVVRPPRLTNGLRTRRFRVAEDVLPSSGSVISRADVADFMLAEAEKSEHVRKIVGVAN